MLNEFLKATWGIKFLIFRFLCHQKQNVKNKAKIEGSICNAYLVEEGSYFCAYYFEPHVMTQNRQVLRNDDGG